MINLVADAHLDLAYELVRKRAQGRRAVLENDYAETIREAGIFLVVSSIYLDDEEVAADPYQKAIAQIDALRDDIQESPSFFLVETCQDIEKASPTKVGVLLSFEGAEPIGTALERLPVFFDKGVRGCGLVWSRRNAFGQGSALSGEVPEGEPGLTAFGRESLEALIKAGYYIDLAHLNDAGFWDALEIIKANPKEYLYKMELKKGFPVMLSHAGCRAINPIARNSSDEQLRAIIELDGFIGVNAMNFIISDGFKIPENHFGYFEHIKHLMQLGGESNIGFGFDFNDQILPFVPQANLDALLRKPFDCIHGYPDLKRLIALMAQNGFTDRQIEKICYKNLRRFLRKVLPNYENH